MNRLLSAFFPCMLAIGGSAQVMSPVLDQADHHILGVIPTLDIGCGWGDWYAEVYAFSATVPFTQFRSLDPGMMTVVLEQEYGPGAAIGGVVFNYVEFDLSRNLGRGWSATASYTNETVPMPSVLQGTRTEHRLWFQGKHSRPAGESTVWGRGRIDLRSIQNPEAGTEGRPEWLFRPRVRLQGGWSRPIGEGPWGVVAHAELFYELWDVRGEADGVAFREQWSALQLTRQVHDNLRVEMGPLLISWWSPDGYDHWLHTWYLQAAIFIDLTTTE